MTDSPGQGNHRFLATLGRLPGTWPALAVTVVAGLCEGLGLALFVPLLEVLDGGGQGAGKGVALAKAVFDAVSLPMNLFTMLVLIVALVGGALAIVFAKDRMLARAKFLHMETLRKALSENLLLSRWDHLSSQSSGEVVNHLLMECHRSASGLTHQVLVVAAAIQALVFAAISVLLSWQLLALTLVLAAIVAGLVRPLHRRSQAIGMATNQANRDYGFHVVDYLKGARLIRVTSSEARVLERMQAFSRKTVEAMIAADVIRAFTFFLVQALVVVVLAGIIAVSHRVLGVPTSVLLAFLLIMARMAPRLIQLQQYYQAYAAYSAALPAVDGAIAAGHAAAEDRRAQGRSFERLEEALELEDVTFRYEDESKGAVEGVSLSIPRHTMTAIVGRSGAGKSTLIDLIAGLRLPDSGRITVDGTDLRELDLPGWRRRIGYVTQDVIVFNDTVRNNLLFAHPDATEEDLRRVLELVQFDDLIATLPDGLATILGEGGVRLSGGQKQRLALARALIADPELLLLDEATSALDNESERLIQKAVESIARRLTIVVVAHRLATVRRADRIFVMDEGRIVEAGTFEELVAEDGRFSRLHEVQFTREARRGAT